MCGLRIHSIHWVTPRLLDLADQPFFVCQPNYSATRRRLALRIIGTLAGILVGLPILYFVPSIEGQLTLIVISGVLFCVP